MLLAVLSYFVSLLCFAHARGAVGLPKCTGEACEQPIDNVVAVTPGSLYIAKIGCSNCDYAEPSSSKGEKTEKEGGHRIVKADYDLFLNVTLTRNKRTILINDQPVYPHIRTIPSPPPIYTKQLRPNFSYANLSSALSCPTPDCRQANHGTIDGACTEWCYDLPLGSVRLDYLYMARLVDYDGEHKEAHAKYWDIALDAIGGCDGYQGDPQAVFDDPKQKMLRVVVAGVEVKTDVHRGGKGAQAGDSLFGSVGEEEKVYEYQIVDVSLEPRAYLFPSKKDPTFWQRIRTFFGMNIWEHDGQLVYLYEEWGSWGKKGTLRNMLGDFIHWDFWYLFWIILTSTIGGLVILYGLYRLVLLILQQRELARWDGMDAVWEQVRRERTVEEENALLDGAYRDDPGEGGSAQPPHYTDEPHTMKPLPNKPLPEKPLPDVPLIDAE